MEIVAPDVATGQKHVYLDPDGLSWLLEASAEYVPEADVRHGEARLAGHAQPPKPWMT